MGPAGSMGALLFSRGRGHSHALRDMAILAEMKRLRPAQAFVAASYSTGAATFTEHGVPAVDLDMPDMNPLWDTVVRAGSLIAQSHPELVVAHEEFVVMPLARAFGVATVFITDWFVEAEDTRMQALRYADEVVFVGEPGVFEEPPFLEGKVCYVGPILRQFEYALSDRNRARQELGLPPDAVIILVAPGGFGTEEREPIADLLLPAFDGLRVRGKLLVWLAGEDGHALGARLKGRSDVILKDHDWQIDRLMVASDLAITKANRTTVRELVALGVRSISISPGTNPIDDAVVERIPTNVALDVRTVKPGMLASAMLDALNSPAPTPHTDKEGDHAAARRAAERLISHLDRRQPARYSSCSAGLPRPEPACRAGGGAPLWGADTG